MQRIIFLYIIVFLNGLCMKVLAQEVFPSGVYGIGGSYNLTVPSTAGRQIGNGMTAAIRKGPNYTGPFQTHNWWNSALWNMDYTSSSEKSPHSSQMYPHPLTIDAQSYGVSLNYRPQDLQVGNDQTDVFAGGYQINVSVNGGSCNVTQVDNYGDWHVQFLQDYSGTELRSTVTKGNPFVFFELTGAGQPLVNGGNQMTVNAVYNNAILFTVNENAACYVDKYFAIYLPSGGTLNGRAPGAFAAGETFNSLDVNLPSGLKKFTMSLMPNSNLSTLQLFEPYAYCIITQTVFSYSFNETTSLLTSTFNVSTTPYDGRANTGTINCLYRHQFLWSPEAQGAANTGLTFNSPRGIMKIIKGNFTTQMTHYGILPHLAKAANMTKTAIETELNFIVNYSQVINHRSAGNDSYNDFMLASKLTKAAEIAHQIGRIDYRDQCLDAAKRIIEDYLTSPDTEDYSTVYSPTFNWMAHYRNSFNSDVGMHDAHFITGFLIYAAATVGRFENKRTGNMNWVNRWKPMVDLVIKNINNYERDLAPADPSTPWFPYLRFFDPYSGHSWFANYAEAQEAISESIHFAAGAMLWGEITNNTAMRDMGAMIFVTESEAGRQYWFDVDGVGSNSALTPITTCNGDAAYAYRHAGIIFHSGSKYKSFFSSNPITFHGITYWPISGHSVWMGVKPSGLSLDYNDYTGTLDYSGAQDHWPVEMLAAKALFNATSARSAYDANVMNASSYFRTVNTVQYHLWAIEGYHWVATLDSVGTVDATTQGNVAFTSVFVKNDCKHYMIYNAPGKGAKTVSFTDGRSFAVPDDTLIVFKVCSPLPVELIEFNAKKKVNISEISWTTAEEVNNNYFQVESSATGIDWKALVQIQGGNSSEIKEYHSQDLNPYRGLNYYRLKQVDLDGKVSYSPIKMLDFSEAENFKIYPNPAQGEFIITNKNNAEVKVFIQNIKGQEILFRIISDSSNQRIKVNCESFAAGTYFVRVIAEDTVVTEKLVVY